MTVSNAGSMLFFVHVYPNELVGTTRFELVTSTMSR